VTRAIFGDSLSVVVRDTLRWPEGKRIGINSAGANILCKAHNSQLGILDDEILKLANACAHFWDRQKPSSVTVSGTLIERWLLKVIVGLAAAGYVGERMHPALSIARQLFGLDPLNERFALYGLSNVSVTREWNRSVSYHFLQNNHTGEVEGAIFLVNSLPIFAYVGDGDPEAALRASGEVAGIDARQVKVAKRPNALYLKAPANDAVLTISFAHGAG
jgi:hypothetical protein